MRIIEKQPLKDPIQLGIVVSRFNGVITERLLSGAVEQFSALGYPTDHLTVVNVPGAVEIPIAIQRLARTHHFDALIAFGSVIRGETTHYDYVCAQVTQGCQHVMMQEDIPVIFGVLTTENVKQAEERVGGTHGHMGKEAVDAAVEMVSVLQQIV